MASARGLHEFAELRGLCFPAELADATIGQPSGPTDRQLVLARRRVAPLEALALLFRDENASHIVVLLIFILSCDKKAIFPMQSVNDP
jgi:hypothetical protein